MRLFPNIEEEMCVIVIGNKKYIEETNKSLKINDGIVIDCYYFDDINDALIEGLSENQDFFSLLLYNEEMKRQVLGIFADEIYKSLRNAD